MIIQELYAQTIRLIVESIMASGGENPKYAALPAADWERLREFVQAKREATGRQLLTREGYPEQNFLLLDVPVIIREQAEVRAY